MTIRAVIRRSAESDLETIEDWMETQRNGLAREFRGSVDEAIARAVANPFVYADLYRGNRRVLLRRFKYALWFRVVGEQVIVLACVHGRRDPRVVSARLRGGE
jgi:plasmid stabilization system protein ParE